MMPPANPWHRAAKHRHRLEILVAKSYCKDQAVESPRFKQAHTHKGPQSALIWINTTEKQVMIE
jgi:hypothetical protein